MTLTLFDAIHDCDQSKAWIDKYGKIHFFCPFYGDRWEPQPIIAWKDVAYPTDDIPKKCGLSLAACQKCNHGKELINAKKEFGLSEL